MSGVDQVERQFEIAGRTITLRRMVANEPLDLPVKAVVRFYAPHELTGTITQGDRRVRISNKEIRENNWPGPPIKGDRMVIDGRLVTIEAVDSRHLGEDLASFVIQVRG